MIELVNTSLPNGLLPGTHGFATVGMTRETPDAVRTLLEGLSSYVHRAVGHDGRYRTENPVAWHHVAPPRGGHVLSRVAACEFDYTGRTNRLARHWQVDGEEWPTECNAARALLANRAWFEEPWVGDARWFDAADGGRLSAGCNGGTDGAPHWVAAYGPQGAEWAAGLARELRRQAAAGPGGRPLVLVTAPSWDPDGTKLLGLFADLIDRLPERERGKATFSTYAAVLPGWVPCLLRGCLADAPELGALTKGRPWFDATAGVLHGAEWLPAEGGVAAMEVRPEMAGRHTGRAGAAVMHERTGAAGAGVRRKKAGMGTGEKAFFAVGGVALATVLGFLCWMLAGGKPKVDPAADGPGEEATVAEGKGEAAAERAPVEAAEAKVVVESAKEGNPDAAGTPEGGRQGVRRLVEGGVWREDKPKPGEAGVRVMYYREADGEWVQDELARTSNIQGLKWIPPKYRHLCLWVDGRNGVFWEFKPATIAVPKNGDKEIDWRESCLGPNESVWREWIAENEGVDCGISYELTLRYQSEETATNILSAGSVRAGELWAAAIGPQESLRQKKIAELQAAVDEQKGIIDTAMEELREMRKEIWDKERNWLNLGDPGQWKRFKEEKYQLEGKPERTDEDNARLQTIQGYLQDFSSYRTMKKEQAALERGEGAVDDPDARLKWLRREISAIEFRYSEPEELKQLREDEKEKKNAVDDLARELLKRQEAVSGIPSRGEFMETVKKDGRLSVVASIQRAEEEE